MFLPVSWKTPCGAGPRQGIQNGCGATGGSNGHTVLTMQAGLWAATTPLNFEEALVALVNSGGDTDTNGALAGAVLGARYGASAIPFALDRPRRPAGTTGGSGGPSGSAVKPDEFGEGPNAQEKSVLPG